MGKYLSKCILITRTCLWRDKLVIIIHTFLQEKLSENEFQKAENFTKMLRKNSGHLCLSCNFKKRWFFLELLKSCKIE